MALMCIHAACMFGPVCCSGYPTFWSNFIIILLFRSLFLLVLCYLICILRNTSVNIIGGIETYGSGERTRDQKIVP